MSQDLKQRLYLAEVDHSELAQVFLSFFGEASRNSGIRVQRYARKGNPACALEVEYNRKGRITALRPSESFNEGEAQQLGQAIRRDLLDNQDPAVGQTVCFTLHRPVVGYFQYKDVVQIIPVPEAAPRCPYTAADHPFLLQFRYRRSNNVSVDAARRQAEVDRWVRLLHFFTQGAIRGAQRYAASTWVLNAAAQTEWRQVGYQYPGLCGAVDTFSPVAELRPIECEAYEQRSSTFSLPDNLEESLDRALHLRNSDEKRFAKASSWYYKSHSLWPISHSATFMSLVVGLESLIDQWDKCDECGTPLVEAAADRCQRCSSPRYRVNRTFKAFLEKYVPGIDPVDLKSIYGVRSLVSHGQELFRRDSRPVILLGLEEQDEDDLQRRMYRIAFAAVYNWLLAHSSGEGPETLSRADYEFARKAGDERP